MILVKKKKKSVAYAHNSPLFAAVRKERENQVQQTSLTYILTITFFEIYVAPD